MKLNCTAIIAATVLFSSVLSGCSSNDPKPAQVMGTLQEAEKAYWMGDIAKAHRWIENAVAIRPNAPETYYGDGTNLGAAQIMAQHGDYKELVKILGPAKNNTALAAQAFMIDGDLGDAYDRLGMKSKSMDAYRDEVAAIVASTTKAGSKLAPTPSLSLPLIKAMAEWNSGDHATGRADLMSIKASDRDHAADAANTLAYMEALSNENLSEAETLAKFAIGKVESTDDVVDLAQYQDTMGWVLHQEGKDKEALPYLQLASNNIPEIADCTYHVAVVYEALGDKDNARKAYARVVSLQPANTQAAEALQRIGPVKPSS